MVTTPMCGPGIHLLIIYTSSATPESTLHIYLSLSDASVEEMVGLGRLALPAYGLKVRCTTIVLQARDVSSIYHLVVPMFMATAIIIFIIERRILVLLRSPHRHVHFS